MLGYVAIGLPCGIMENAIGLSPSICFVVSCTFYSGAGQFMVPNLWLAGTPVAAIIASVSFVNTRQVLYSTAFAPYFARAGRLLSFFFAATVTDESFGVNMERFEQDRTWTPACALAVNICSMLSWATANACGCALGNILDLPLAITSFAMTSIFICLAATQRITRQTLVVMLVSFCAVGLLKACGLSGPAILLGAVAGVGAGMVVGGKGDVEEGSDGDA